MYTVERVPLPEVRRGRQANPIALQMRSLNVGESFVVSYEDRNWTGHQVRNENSANKEGRLYVTVKETRGIRIGRVA